MKIRMKSMAFTQSGMFDKGNILSTEKGESFDGKAYPVEFLNHLVQGANAADMLDYETKVDMEYEPIKKPLSSQSLPQAKVSPERTVKKRKSKRKS